MSLIRNQCICAAKTLGVCVAFMALAVVALAQTISTTTVQGTVYLANGSPGSGTLQLSWPAFTTASNQTIAAEKITTTIGADGFVSVNLAPNLGSSPAGLYYTAIYHMSDGTTSTEYWVVPAAAQASIAQVRSQVMPAAQAAQAVSKAYVDQAVQSVAQGNLTSTGGQLTGPLYLTGDPTQSLQAADKHYVDASMAQAVPLSGGAVNGPLTARQLGAAYQVDQFPGADFGAKLQACFATISGVYGGTCDARNFSGNLAMAANLTISTANTTVMLPCATISTASQIIVAAGTRNVSLRGCALRGASNASGSQGGTVLLYSGSVAAIQVGDPTYAADTNGFHLDNVVVNTTAANGASAQALAMYRTQELDLESLYLLGNANQTGMTLDGTGNYAGGTFYDNHISGFQTAINGIGHQVTNSASTDWLNASTFVRLHIDCPTANGNPIPGSYGVNLQQGDGNTFTGGDVENCGTAVHLGANAQNNTIVGLRNENSTYQVVADAGSSYNSWMTGGTMFTGKLTDNGTRNSFLDTFHRSFNSLNGDWYGSQQDATLTNHLRLGIGNGNERGLLDRYQTDYGYRWTMGLSDATGGEQFYQVLDELNSVYRLSIGQYNSGQSSTNNQTVVNAAGAGAVVLNGSNNAGTGGVVFGSGGALESTVATVSNTGNATFNGTLQVGSTAQSTGTMTVRNNADAEVDYYLWPGLTTSQKGSFTYKDWNGNSQWYMVKDASNNWALNSAIGGLDSFKAYQSTNSGDTYINASNASGVVRVNYETGAGSAFNIYGGNSGNLYASFSGNTSIKFPGLSASSGHNCLQIDSSGYITNSGAACGSGSGSGTVNSGSTGQIAYYNGTGTAVSGMSSIPVSAGGTGASTAAGALAALGGVSLAATTSQNLAGPLNASVNTQINVMMYGAKGDCVTDDHNAIILAQTAALSYATGSTLPAALYFPKPPGGCYYTSAIQWAGESLLGQPASGGNVPVSYGVVIKGKPSQDILYAPDPLSTSFTWYPSASIHDISFLTDTSVQTPHAHRWPGRWFDDGGMTSGSAVLTTTRGEISCGDVGQAIQVNGAGPSGANLVTTIASVSPCWAMLGTSQTDWQVITLSANASTTVTNAHTYLSVLGFPVTQTLNNCAMGFDMQDGNPADWANPSQSVGLGALDLKNVTFGSTNGSTFYTCGMYTSGYWAGYKLDASNINVTGQLYGIVQTLPELNSYLQSNGDYQHWDHLFFFVDTYPWISVDGLANKLSQWQLNTLAGPQILTVGTNSGDIAAGWDISDSGFETYTGTTNYGWRIEGYGHTINGVGFSAGAATGQINANSTKCYGCGGSFTVTGNNNDTDLGQSTYVGATLTNRGRGNTLVGSYNAAGPYSGFTLPWKTTIFPMKGDGRNIIGRVTGDNIFDGNYSTPYNKYDLQIWPEEFSPGPGSVAYSTFFNYDSTSLSGESVTFPPSLAVSNFSTVPYNATNNNTALSIGSQIPAGKVTVAYSVKCPNTVTSYSLQMLANSTTVATDTETCSTSYAIHSFVADYTSYSTDVLGIKNSGANNLTLAWIVIRPYVHDINGFPIGGTGADILTGSGNGGYLSLWSGSGASYTLGSSLADYGITGAGVFTFKPLNGMSLTTSTAGENLYVTSSWSSSGGGAELWLQGGTYNANIGTKYEAYNPTLIDYWETGMFSGGVHLDWIIKDDQNNNTLLDFPNNTMPANSIGGNANGATAITQAASDNSTNIATDAFVKSNLPLTGTTTSIGGSALSAGACTSGTVNVTGATTSMAVVATPATYPGDGMDWRTYVSSSGVVTVKVCAAIAGTPMASTYNVRVIP